MPSEITPTHADLAVATDTDFAALSELLLSTVAASSTRVYAQTLRAWEAWCAEHEFDPMDLTPRQVLAFLASAETTKATRQRQLSALRKLAQMRFILTPGDDEARSAPLAGIEAKPHDARRTFITEALTTGTPISTVQQVVGHERGDTTLRYAQTVDARRAKKELKLRYG